MPLNTEVKGDTNSLRAMADWQEARSRGTQATAGQVYGARGDADGAWRGTAASGFQTTSSQAGQRIDTLGTDLGSSTGALRSHADDRDTVTTRMQQAREVAKRGGLTVRGFVIEDPGPAPAAPKALPSDRAPTPAEDAAHQAGTHAQNAYANKVAAFQEASKTVAEANTKLSQSQQTLMRFVGGFAEKSPFTITDIATGLAGAVSARSSDYRATAKAMDPAVARAARYAGTPRMNPFAQARADALEITRRINQQTEYDKAVASRTARMVDKLPDWAKRRLTANLNGNIDPKKVTNPLLRGGTKVLSKLPVVGLGITGLSTAYDIGQGKDPTTAVASNAGGFAAGSLATAGVLAAGGPVGWGIAAGVVVGAGVGFAIEEWGDDAVNAVETGANWVGDRLSDFGSGVSDFFGF